jgi:pimeloyl-ACP methyl ester carboxylesterase
MPITTADLLAFLRAQRFAVQASRGAGEPVQAAVVGIAVTDALEIGFDPLATTRKVRNLRFVGADDVPEAANVANILMEHVAGTERITIPGAGHMLNLAAPEAFDAAIAHFLRARRARQLNF